MYITSPILKKLDLVVNFLCKCTAFYCYKFICYEKMLKSIMRFPQGFKPPWCSKLILQYQPKWENVRSNHENCKGLKVALAL